MPYDWSALVFVQKWRPQVARGILLGASRAGDQTVFDLRLQASEWSTSHPASFADLHLLDAGDVIREKRLGLLERASVIVQITTPSLAKPDRCEKSYQLVPLARAQRIPNARRTLDVGSVVCGEVAESDGERYLLVDVGFPTVVSVLDQSALAEIQVGDWVELVVQIAPKGFIVLG